MTRRYGEVHGLSTATARISNPYGPMERVSGHRAVMSVFYQWTGKVVRGEAIQCDKPNQGRDYTYGADIAEGVRTVLDAPVLPHHLYNVTAGVWLKQGNILAQLRELSPTIQVITAEPGKPQPHSREYSRGPLSGHRLRQDLSWAPRYDLASGLAEYLQWRRDTHFLD